MVKVNKYVRQELIALIRKKGNTGTKFYWVAQEFLSFSSYVPLLFLFFFFSFLFFLKKKSSKKGGQRKKEKKK